VQNELGAKAMLVGKLMLAARARLVTIADDAPLIEAAKLLRAGTDLVVVCGPEGLLAGVVTKTDVVDQISQCLGRVAPPQRHWLWPEMLSPASLVIG
jgi:CBS domain-containing protein